MKPVNTIVAAIAALALTPALLHAEDLIRNGSFEAELQDWFLDQHRPAMATTTFQTTDPDGKKAIEIEVVQPGDEAWKVQLAQIGFRISAGTVYTLTFFAKAEPEVTGVVAAISQASAPYAVLALKEKLTLSPEWNKFVINLIPKVDEPNARLLFSNLGGHPGKVWISQVSLVENE